MICKKKKLVYLKKLAFRISSNFTVKVFSSTDLQIKFNPGKISSLCHGNLTRDDQIQLPDQV